MKFGFLWETIYNAQDAWSQYQGVFGYGFWSRRTRKTTMLTS